MNEFIDHIMQQFVSCKEQLLIKIVAKVRGKDEQDVNETDVKGFSFITHAQYPGREFIGNEHGLLGEIVVFQKEENHQWKMGFEFIPKAKFNE